MTDAPSQPIAPGTLSGTVALVTGSSRGIGADTVRYLAQAGADVVINFRNKAPRAEKLATELRGLGVDVLTVGADLTDAASVSEMFAAVKERFGSLDILVLNASGGMEGGRCACRCEVFSSGASGRSDHADVGLNMMRPIG